jgi:ABC-type branched-subunit amino acid transport system substrate-binding protein
MGFNVRPSTGRTAVALLLAASLLLASCGNSDDDAGADGTTTEAPDATSGAPGTTADLTQFVALDEPGVTDDEIRVSSLTSTTNPLGGSYGDAVAGTRAYFEMVNSEGGIYGRDLVIVEEHDDNVGKNQQEAQAILAQDDVFAVVPVATLLFTGAADLADAGVPTFGWNINPEWSGPPNLFGEKGSHICFECGRAGWPYVARELGRSKVGILAYGVSDQSKQCAAGWRDSFERYPTAEVAFFDDTLPYGVPDLSGEVSAMKEAGVDVVLTCMDQNGVVTLAREIQRQELDAIQFLNNAYDEDFVAEYGDLFEGSIVGIQFWPFENTTDQPQGMIDYLEWMEATGGPVNELSMAGWLSADLFVTGLGLAGPEFSREKVIDALNGYSEWDANGLNPGFDWTIAHDQEQPESCFAQLQITEGAFETIFGEPGKPFLCFPDDAEELVEPEPRS